MVREIERDWQTPSGGDFVRAALLGVEFFRTPKPRWESLHDVQAIGELYAITGDERYRKAVTHIWESIRRYDRHNTGAFSSGEAAKGNPYDPGAIETCCVIAWIALSIDMLCMTGDSTFADEIELATFNAVFGAQHPSGRWFTYNTPMDGVRRAATHDIVFQAHRGAPELNCCSANGPRGLGMLSEWAVLLTNDGVAVNFYGPCTIELPLAPGEMLTLAQTTDYPRDGTVTLRLGLAKPREFAVWLRIPVWSQRTEVLVDGRKIDGVRPGSYLVLNRQWSGAETIRLSFDMSLHIWVGEREVANSTSIYRGPILLAYDQRLNTMDPDDVPWLDAGDLCYTIDDWQGYPKPWLLLRFCGADGRSLSLCDFASAGATGTHYRTWLHVRDTEELPPERRSPFASRVGECTGQGELPSIS
jgi:DUF1680 family protein